MKNQPEKARNRPSLRLSEQSRKDMDKPTINPWCGALTGVSSLYMINWSVKMLTKYIGKYYHRGTEDKCKLAVSLYFCTIGYIEIMWI